MGMNMKFITSHPFTPPEAQDLIHAGIISPASLIDVGAPILTYARFITPTPKTGIPLLDEQVTSNGPTAGFPNFDLNRPKIWAIDRVFSMSYSSDDGRILTEAARSHADQRT
jgi:hypothetical protein